MGEKIDEIGNGSEEHRGDPALLQFPPVSLVCGMWERKQPPFA